MWLWSQMWGSARKFCFDDFSPSKVSLTNVEENLWDATQVLFMNDSYRAMAEVKDTSEGLRSCCRYGGKVINFATKGKSRDNEKCEEQSMLEGSVEME